MKFNSKLLNEAIADANEMKELAIQNAMSRLKEHFEPAVKRIISTKLSEIDDLEDEDENEDAYAPEPDGDEDPMEEPAEEAPMDEPTEDEFSDEDEDELGLDEIIAELEGELDEPVEDEDNMDESDDMEEPEQDDEYIDESEDTDMEDEDEDIPSEDIAEIRKRIRESLKRRTNARTSKVESRNSNSAITENKRLKMKLAESHASLEKAAKVVQTQKSALNEINLLNTKLIYLTKLTSVIPLTGAKQLKVLESFDRAKTPREVKLIYTALCESLGKQTKNKSRTLREGASAPVRVMNKQTTDTGFAMKSRWQKLAGITG